MSAPIRSLLLVLLLACTSGCVSKQVKRVNEVQAQQASQELPLEQLLDVTIVAFDPNIPADIKDQEKQGVLPEVRKAEANYLPQVLRQSLDGTGYWGTVRVLPEAPPSSMLVVSGKILHSDGQTLKLHVEARDATGREWLDKNYEEVAAEISYTDPAAAKSDPFQDLYSRVANDLLKERNKLDAAKVQEVRRVADLKFAADLAPARFAGYLKTEKGRTSVQRLPPENDPIVKRIASVRARDDVLVDTLDGHYAVFRQNMQPAYQEWRRANYTEVVARDELEKQALWRKVAGAAAVIAGAAAAIGSDSVAGSVMGQVGVIAGVGIFASGMQKGQEAKVHADAVKELNASINADVAPRVVELEGKTVTLTGSAKDQYDQWRKLLHERYAAEIGTP